MHMITFKFTWDLGNLNAGLHASMAFPLLTEVLLQSSIYFQRCFEVPFFSVSGFEFLASFSIGEDMFPANEAPEYCSHPVSLSYWLSHFSSPLTLEKLLHFTIL